jgi:hypothetical protein
MLANQILDTLLLLCYDCFICFYKYFFKLYGAGGIVMFILWEEKK